MSDAQPAWYKRFHALPVRIMQHHPFAVMEGWIGKLLLASFIGWELLTHLGPHRPLVSPLVRQEVDQQISLATDDLAQKTEQLKIGRLAVLPLDRDDSGYATAQLRQEMYERGIGQQPDPPLSEKLRNLLNLALPSYDSVDSAVDEGKSLGVDAVVFGQVKQDGPKVDMDLELADVDNHRTYPINVSGSSLTTTVSDPMSLQPVRINSSVILLRQILIWAIIALLLPVFTISMIREVVRQHSNARNAYALSIYTVVDVLLLWLLLADLSATWLLLSLLAGGFVSFTYNVSIMTWALKLET